MKSYYFFLFIITLFSCINSDSYDLNLIDLVPEEASIILRTNSFESLKSSINNNNFIQNFSNSKTYRQLVDLLEPMSHLKPDNDVLICFSKDVHDSLQYSIITKYNQSLFITDSLTNYIEETLTHNDKTITKSTLDNNTFYSTSRDSVFFISSSKILAEASFNKKSINPEFEKIYSSISNDKNVTISISNKNNMFINSFFVEQIIPFKTFTNMTSIDVDMSQNEILFNGITKGSDSVKSLINIFKNTIPQENQLSKITPSNSGGFMSITFDDFHSFEANLLKFKKQDSIISETALFDDVIEVGVIYNDKNKAIVLNSIDEILTKDALIGNQNLIETYRQIEIYTFTNSTLFSETFSPFISFNAVSKYFVIDNFFVFSNSVDMLHNIISNYQNKTTLSEQDYFKDIQNHLSDEASLISVITPSTLQNILEGNLDEDLNIKIDDYKVSAIQFVYDHNFAHVNAVIKKNKSRASQYSVSEEFNIKLDSDLLNDPQLVINHINRQKEIVVQDINNNLYLISNSGKILWKKQLHGPVLGHIEQIDIYKNGRLQLAFATPNRIYVIDRKGRDVSPFPAKFNDEITQPLSVFDYDKRKNYRLLVTQGKNVLMFDVNAKPVRGFTFKSAESYINHQPQHFRIGSKDYITVKTDNKLHILDRTGRTRISPKSSSTFSDQAIYIYKNKFTSTAKNGELITIDTNGNLASQNLSLTDQHNIVATSKTLVAQTENKLNIKTRTVELDYGIYTKPQIFYINDKIYVAITDLQTQKIFLFDSQAKPIANFPVYGNSIITLDNIDSDRNLEFVVKGEDNSILVYKIN